MAIYNINYLNESMSVQDMSPVFQKIFNIIDNNIKYSFEKLIVKGIITEGSYEYKFWLYDRGKP